MSKRDDLHNDTATEIRHMSILLEQVLAQNQLVLEAVGDMQDKVRLIPQIQADVANLKDDMKVVKAAVIDTNRELHALDARVTRLEAAA